MFLLKPMYKNKKAVGLLAGHGIGIQQEIQSF